MDERIMKWAGILGLEIVVALVMSLLIIGPQLARMRQANLDLQTQQKTLIDLNTKSELLANFIIDFSGDTNVLGNIFPQSSALGLVVSSLRQLAGTSQIELITYEVRASSADEGATPSRVSVPSLTIELTVNGSADSTQAFIDSISKSLPLKSIEDFNVVRSLVADQTGGVTQLIQTKLSLKSYYLPFNIKVDSTKPLDPFGTRQVAALQEFQTYILPPTPSVPTLTTQPIINPNLFGQ